MSSLTYSLRDIYPNSATALMKTAEQTIPEPDEEEHYIDTETVTNNNGQLEVLDKSTIWGAILLLVGVLVLIHFM